MQGTRRFTAPLVAAVLLAASPALAQVTVTIDGNIYMKWLWGNQRDQGALYNFTTVPGEGYGDNGQGSEIELLVGGRLSKKVEISARIHSRFNQNFWTNFGGFGGRNDIAKGCQAGDCGEYDPRSNQYVKLRGATIVFTPGYSWLDSALIGSSDLGMFDPYVVGRIRYIDRDNAAGLLLQGSALNRKLTWDAMRISLPRLWAGPGFTTGNYAAGDAAYTGQMKFTANSLFDIGIIGNYIDDVQVDTNDHNLDNGRSTVNRYRNTVWGGRVGIHPISKVDVRAAYYWSTNETNGALAPANFCLTGCGYSPVIGGKHTGWSGRANVDLNDPFGIGLSFNLEGFLLKATYSSLLAARRESDVLLTEGHDGAFYYPGPANAAYGVFAGNPTRLGYGGWDGPAQQVATINVDNEFTDFDEPMAETVIGWKGFTIAPVYSKGNVDVSGEYTHIGYDTNWQAFGDPSRSIMNTDFPTAELDTGVGHNFRSAFAPFQDKKTDIAVLKVKYVADVGTGIDFFGKVKYIRETDNRMNDTRYLPYLPGDCAANPAVGCAGGKNFYSAGNTTADLYGNPPVITVTNPVTGAKQTGYQWKPFDSLSDDNRDLKYTMFNLGMGYQLTADLYGSLTYQYFHADLKDGDTAMQGYNLHEMASGKTTKNQLIARFRYNIAGISECGLEYQYNFGTFEPDFGTGYVVQYATADIANGNNVPLNSPGFSGRYGGWNSLAKREFDQQRLKFFLKVHW